MKILITGGCGFIGTNLSIYLKNKGFKIYTVDNFTRKGSKYNKKILEKNKIKNYYLDITNNSKFKRLPKFDLIIDCCAEPAVEVSKNEIDRVFNTNLVGTFNILKKCVKDKSHIIFLSSSREITDWVVARFPAANSVTNRSFFFSNVNNLQN